MRAFLAFLLAFIFGKPTAVVTPIPSVMPSRAVETTRTVDGFSYGVIKIATPSSVSLLTNFRERTDTETLMQKNNCAQAVNGGFYTKTNSPLGLLRTGDKWYAEKIESDLVNGFIWIDREEHGVIASEIPNGDFRIALQTGPLLLFNSKPLPLQVNNDTNARRVVAARTQDGTLVFITLYNPESVFSGPILSRLPDVITKLSTQENLQVTEAINLDGGSASAFYGGTTKLSELTPVGSLFCIKE